jgi:hypothetical protein
MAGVDAKLMGFFAASKVVAGKAFPPSTGAGVDCICWVVAVALPPKGLGVELPDEGWLEGWNGLAKGFGLKFEAPFVVGLSQWHCRQKD